ncbi:MAG: ankyrin repeat domain-containing protein [Candidatus Aenigmarchaeota archaeon]|nr:ankyrin repeat domain-containing protein [Candidatus Aenigmarchaeota archaeon]
MADTLAYKINDALAVCWAAAQGDLQELQRLVAGGIDLNAADYDGRTGLHLAASEGNLNIVTFLVKKNVNINPKDRWGFTPLIDAKRGNHKKIIEFFEKNGGKA